MGFKLSITTDNAAFSEEEGGPNAEVARLLREVADDIENGRECGTIMDINGNNVGKYSL